MDVSRETLMALVGLFLPLLVALLKQAGWSQQANALVACVVYVAVGGAALVISGQPVTLDNLAVDIGIVGATGTIAYNLFWSNMGVRNPGEPSWDDIIENATSVAKHGVTGPQPSLSTTGTPTK